MPKIREIVDIMERLAPSCTQADFDNSGFQVGNLDANTEKVLCALELEHWVIEEAERLGAGLIITHHPLLFHPLKNITSESYEGRLLLKLMRAGIALYSSHTPLDACRGGVNDCLCDLIGLHDVCGFYPQSMLNGAPVYCCRIGCIEPESLGALADRIGRTLKAEFVRFSPGRESSAEKIAVCSGSGSGLAEEVIASGADTFITGELKYHDMLRLKEGGVACIEAGHYHTEYPIIPRIISHLQNELNELQYKIAVLDAGFNEPYGSKSY